MIYGARQPQCGGRQTSLPELISQPCPKFKIPKEMIVDKQIEENLKDCFHFWQTYEKGSVCFFCKPAFKGEVGKALFVAIYDRGSTEDELREFYQMASKIPLVAEIEDRFFGLQPVRLCQEKGNLGVEFDKEQCIECICNN